MVIEISVNSTEVGLEYIIRSYNVKFPKANKLWVWFQLIT
jgi:hypothetical protein